MVSHIEPELEALAAAYGVTTSYVDWQGHPTRPPRDSICAVLHTLGVDTSDIGSALHSARMAPWRKVLPPYLVVREGRPSTFAVHVPVGGLVEIWVEAEDGEPWFELLQLMVHVDPVEVDGVPTAELRYQLPVDLPIGWHTLRLRCGDAIEAIAPIAVTPQRLPLPDPAWGFMAQLYAVRSAGSWGVGDLHDLGELARWSGEMGAGLLLINPLHAASPLPPMEPSPYFPSSRRFRNPLYLRVEDVPEAAALPNLDRLAAPLRGHPDHLIDRDAAWAAKREALEAAFLEPRSVQRQAALDAYVAREGHALTDFATWCTLSEVLGSPTPQWPAELRDAHGSAVEAFRHAHSARLDFHRWLQWLLDEQVSAAQHAARDAGMSIGIIHDLAVGADPAGADAWANADVLAGGVTLGAPPDAFNQRGQDWSQVPWRPDRLAGAGLAPYRELLASAFHGAGGLRVDHVLGLFRQWWVPEGAEPSEGTYVRLDHEALVGVLALEAYRAGALVIGEDIGTVEPWVHDYLDDRGIPGTSILWFERDDKGRPKRPEDWRRNVLASVTTHDLPPTAALLGADFVDLRHALGLLTRPVEAEREQAIAERDSWVEALVSRGLVAPDAPVKDQVVAMHAYLGQTPSLLRAVWLPDVVGDLRPANQPGTADGYPSWRLPISDGSGDPVSLEAIERAAGARILARSISPRAASVTVSLSDESNHNPRES